MPQYTIPRGVSDLAKAPFSIPGPQDYHVKKVLREVQALTIQKAPRNPKEKLNPTVGPGSYQFRSFLDEKVPGTTMFPREKLYRGRDEVNPLKRSVDINPGPGQYNIETTSKHSSKRDANRTELNK